MRPANFILATLFLAGATFLAAPAGRTAAGADAKDRPAAATRPAAGATLAAQKRLAELLNALKGESLTASLSHNRAEWETLSPDQRSRFRQEAMAFLSESPDQQERLLRQYQRLISLSAERQENYRRIARWLKVVVDSMTPEERKGLLEMPPDKRARAILARKAELISQGKLSPDPATLPAGPPAGNTTE